MSSHRTTVTPDFETYIRGRNPELTGQKLDVYTFVKSNPYCTRDQISRGLGMRASTSTARVKELIDIGLLVETDKTSISRAGVTNRTLIVNDDFQHRKPRDRVCVNVHLLVGEDGNYYAKAEVVGGNNLAHVPKNVQVHEVLTRKFTVVAPYPNEYMHKFIDDTLAKVPRTDTINNADLIVDD